MRPVEPIRILNPDPCTAGSCAWSQENPDRHGGTQPLDPPCYHTFNFVHQPRNSWSCLPARGSGLPGERALRNRCPIPFSADFYIAICGLSSSHRLYEVMKGQRYRGDVAKDGPSDT